MAIDLLQKKIIMACTGAALVFFLAVHLVGNATIFAGVDSFVSYVDFLKEWGVGLLAFEAALFTIFSVHIYYGVRLSIAGRIRKGRSYSTQASLKRLRLLAPASMPWSGLVLGLYIVFHVYSLRFAGGGSSSQLIIELNSAFETPLILIIYIMGLLAMALHISHGTWSIFQTLGALPDKMINRAPLISRFISAVVFVAFLFVLLFFLLL